MSAFMKRPRWSIFGGMKVKTSITLSRELLQAVDARTGRGRRRSEFIEAALQAFLDKSMRDERGARDLEILNRRATRLNREAVDVLAYQVIP
jgi:metal-responsive CopG/Arc/MetJ family transcriptional regulator